MSTTDLCVIAYTTEERLTDRYQDRKFRAYFYRSRDDGRTWGDPVLVGRHPHIGRWADESADDIRMARDALARLSLTGFESRALHTLSGGERQRVAIARALVTRPACVLADEPTGNLDTASSSEVFALLRRIHQQVGTTFLIVTHDPRLAARCDRVIELVDGRVHRDGPADRA